MTKKLRQNCRAVPVLALLLLGSTAFTKKAKDLTTGGGVAEGHHFHYTAVEIKSTISGKFSWDGASYHVIGIYKTGKSATIYLSGGMAVNVEDNENGDWITPPFAFQSNCCNEAVSPDTPLAVDSGNLIVNK